MCYRLRTLLIALALGPPLLGWAGLALVEWQSQRRIAAEEAEYQAAMQAVAKALPPNWSLRKAAELEAQLNSASSP